MCKGSVKGLKEGEEYQFRVFAVNKAGLSEPSDPSKRITAKPRFCESTEESTHNAPLSDFCILVKPHIDRNAMKPITVKAGQNVDFDVPVKGEPPPDLVWTYKGEKLENGQKDHVGHIIRTSTNILVIRRNGLITD